MNPPKPAPTTAATPELRRAQRWNIVWVVPIIALLLGAWMLYRNFAAQGPVASISFETAEEIYSGKTEIRCRSVKVGIVKSVNLAHDLNSVMVNIELSSESENLLCQGTRFWVVKPRLSAAEVSGLGTLIQGAYIELDPGPTNTPRISQFKGLETPPATNSSVPGRRLILTTTEASPLQIGAPVYYRGFEVGRIEGLGLAADGSSVNYNAFISEEYSHLVTTNTRFWNTSGIEISGDTEGIKLRTPSLQAMVSGGVSFGITGGMANGEPAHDGDIYTLFSDRDAAKRSTIKPSLKFLLLFDQSVRGLTTSSSVEFRGIPIGRISSISFDLVAGAKDPRIPVLIEIDPTLVRPETARQMTEPDSQFFQEEINKGLRAGLKTSSYVTGTVHVDLDYYPDAIPAKLGTSGNFTTFPTISSGLAQIEAKLSAVLDKLQAMPLHETMNSIAAAADEGKTMAAAARKALEDPAFQALPSELQTSLAEIKKTIASIGPNSPIQGDILRTLDELRASLRSLKAVTTTIDEKPNSLLFGRESSNNSTPKAPQGH